MHEMGIVFHIAKRAEELAHDNNVTKVTKVVLSIGEVSGVVGDYLTDCWKWNAKKSPILDGCELIIETVDAVTYCEDCKKTYPTVQYGKTCPYCQSGNTYLVQGNETDIKEMEVC